MKATPLSSAQLQRLQEGAALFNRGEFFECHEVLEGVWLEASGGDKTFLQGLIQVAVSFHHLRHGNFTGAERLLRAAIDKLATPADCRRSIDLGRLLDGLTPLLQAMEGGRASSDHPAPEIRYLPPA